MINNQYLLLTHFFLKCDLSTFRTGLFNSGSSMRRSTSNACKNIFSLTSKEYVSRESMLISDLDHKQL